MPPSFPVIRFLAGAPRLPNPQEVREGPSPIRHSCKGQLRGAVSMVDKGGGLIKIHSTMSDATLLVIGKYLDPPEHPH